MLFINWDLLSYSFRSAQSFIFDDVNFRGFVETDIFENIVICVFRFVFKCLLLLFMSFGVHWFDCTYENHEH